MTATPSPTTSAAPTTSASPTMSPQVAAGERTSAGTTASAPGASLSRAEVRRRLLVVARPVLAPLGASAVARVVALLTGTALLAAAAWGVGETAGGADVLGRVVLVMVGLSLVKGVARYLEQLAGHYVAFRALALLRTYFYDRLEPQAPAATEGRQTGDLLSRVTKDVDRVEVFFAHTLVPVVTAVVVPVLTVGYLAVAVDPLAGAVLVPFLLLVGIGVPAWGRRRTAEHAATLRAVRGETAQHVTDSVQGVREVLAFDHAGARLAGLDALGERSGRSVVGIGGWLAVRRSANTLLVGLALVAQLVVLTGGGGRASWTSVAVALAVTVSAFLPVLAVEDVSADLEQAYASARRILEVTDAAPVVADPLVPVRLPLAAPTITLDDVTFTYPSGPDAPEVQAEPALRGLTLHLAAGTTTAVVGASGSGKSTLAALLVRFWDPDSGTVALDGTDLRDVALDDLRETVALAQQRPYLFNETIEENLRTARPGASDADVARACRLSALDEVVEHLPDGLATQVGEMGERLSGGQRQRLAVARALLRESSVLVLDEATSQLDAVAEARVLAGVREASEGRTVVVVAHRLSTVTHADQIVVLDAGRLVEQGTHEELLALGGAYATLLDREAASLDHTEDALDGV